MPVELPTPDVCAVCLTAPSMLGVLDSCAHVFCVPCVARWATIETKCPLCKARFTCATPTTVDEQGVRSQTGDVIKFEETNQGERARGGDDDDDFEDEYDDMANVMCEVCHRGDDDEFLMLCDGCDAGCHSFCVGLATVPRGQWYCAVCRGSAVVREQAAARSRARDILLRVEGGTRAVRRRERVMDRERRAARARERGEIYVAGGGGERVATGNDARVRQISRVHELREAWSLLQSGQMEFPGWNRANTPAAMTPDPPRLTVPSAPRARGEEAPEGDVVEEAWDVLEKAMKDQSTTASTSKRRTSGGSGKDIVRTQDASPPPKVLKRPAVRAAPSGWSLSAVAWAPSMKAPRVTSSPSPEASPAVVSNSPSKPKRELSNLPPKEIAKIAVGIVKDILKPRYANGQITRDEFKATAKQATQMSVDASTIDPEEIARIVNRLLDY